MPPSQQPPPATASLTGAVTSLSQARAGAPSSELPPPSVPPFGFAAEANAAVETAPTPALPTPTPAPIESASGRGSPAILPNPPLAAENAGTMGPDPTEAHVADPDSHASHVSRRRRRSASPLPPLPSPADIPEDAPGRVTFLTVATSPDVVPPPLPATEAPLPQPAPALSSPADPLREWLPVVVLGLSMLLVFIVGMVVTR